MPFDIADIVMLFGHHGKYMIQWSWFNEYEKSHVESARNDANISI